MLNNYNDYIENVNKGKIISFENFCNKYVNEKKQKNIQNNDFICLKKFVVKKITKDYYGYRQIKYIKMFNMSRKKKFVTMENENGVLVKANIETGETRLKTRLEVLQNIKNSKARTIKKMRDYVQANKWEYFLTLTFNNDLQDRYNDKEVLKNLDKYLQFLRRKYPNMYYVCVPEYHKIKALHFHMIIGGISSKELGLKYWKSKKCKDGNGYQKIYKITTFKYGFTTATKVENSSACGNYILKYITKSMGIVDVSAKRYYASRNLKLPETSIINNFVDFDCDVKSFIDVNINLGAELVFASNKSVIFKINYDIYNKLN